MAATIVPLRVNTVYQHCFYMAIAPTMNAREKTLKTVRKHGQARPERAGLLLLIMGLLALISLGLIYRVELTPAEPSVAPEPVSSRINQLCQQKLLEHLKQGGLDLQTEMNYGDLQGCNFGSESEQRSERRNSGSIAWKAALN